MTRTDEALAALMAALAAQAGLPELHDNRNLPGEFAAEDGVGRWFNLIDGDGETSPMLGEGTGPGEGLYEIDHQAELEWIVQANDPAARRAAFDEGLDAIAAALEEDRTLGGVVDFAEVARVERSRLATDGIPEIKAAIVTIRLTFTSARPF